MAATMTSPGTPTEAEALLQGTSSHITSVRELIGKIAASNCNVLISGETGTGKELVARLIHEGSRRKKARLATLNCAAVPDSLIESELFGYERGAFTGAYQRNEGRIWEANGGTMFLDEIGEMTLAAQAKILRSLETRTLQRLGGGAGVAVDVRIVAATNQNLEQMVAAGRFRKDLYFRLNVARIYVAPLRERKTDIPQLARHFLRLLSREMDRPPVDFDEKAMDALLRYDYPGNVRELRNVVEVALIHQPYPLIASEHLPDNVRFGECLQLEWVEDRSRILSALSAVKWNKSKAAKKLQWSRMTLYRKMARYEIGEDRTAQTR